MSACVVAGVEPVARSIVKRIIQSAHEATAAEPRNSQHTNRVSWCNQPIDTKRH